MKSALNSSSSWSVSDARLVQEIRQHSTLYDPKKRGYNTQPDKDLAWETVAQTLAIQAVEAKNRWRNIRDRYVREKKRLVNDGEQIYRLKDPWPLLDEMSFLRDFITHRNPDKCSNGSASNEPGVPVPKKKRKVSEHPLKSILPRPGADDYLIQTSDRKILPRPSPEWVSVTLDYENTDEAASSPGIESSYSLAEEEQHKVFKREPDDDQHGSQLRRLLEDGISESEELHPLMTGMDDSQEHIQDLMSKDEDELYCLSVAASLKRFTPKMKAIAKCKIQQVLFDVEFNESGPSGSKNYVVTPQ